MMITLYTNCPFCGKRQYVTVEQKDYDRYVKGEHAQKAFPYLTPAEREIIISGICEECWDKMFKREAE